MIRPLVSFLIFSAALAAEPLPGDYFREYTYTSRFGQVDAGAKHPTALQRMRGVDAQHMLEIPGIGKPLKAEISVSYWGGHVGTSQQRFRINGNEWIDIPQPQGTPGRPQCYYRTIPGRATVEVPIEHLKPGRNAFQFMAGPQICYSFNWGFYWVYSFTVRLYYKPPAEAPGAMLAPVNGAEIGENPRIVATAHHPDKRIASVEFIGRYEDFNWEGDGVWRQWHYITERGRLAKHIGTAIEPPYATTWDTTWIPDQDEPVEIAARITDLDGMIYVTPPAKVTFARRGRSVKMYKARNVPEAFGVRVGRKKECTFEVDGTLSNARAARLIVHTWSAAHGDEIGFNAVKLADRVGLVHNYSFDTLPVPVRLVKPGTNSFYIFSNTKEHALEVNWPGPALLVEFHTPAPAAAAWAEPKLERRIPVTVRASGYERVDAPVEAAIDFGRTAPRSIRVFDAATGESVPHQFDADAKSGKGALTFLMPGVTPAHASRRFDVYFGPVALGRTGTGAALVRVTEVDYEGQRSYRIETPAATYTYHKEGAGFASIRDAEGREWIGYKPGGRAAGEYRGIPNTGEFAHPGYTGKTGSNSRITAQGPLKATIYSERQDGARAARWDIFPTHARMTMLKTDKPYWFLYEGTPGGTLDAVKGFYVTSDGRRRALAERFSGDMPAPEWLYFGVPDAKQALFLVNHHDDAAPDQYWPMDGSMTVFGFGREYTCCGMYLNAAPAQFTIGLAPNAGFNGMARAIDSAWRELRIEVGGIETQPRKSSRE